MAHDWLVGEIAALRDFAELNGLARLAEALDEARLVALIELAIRNDDAGDATGGEEAGDGTDG